MGKNAKKIIQAAIEALFLSLVIYIANIFIQSWINIGNVSFPMNQTTILFDNSKDISSMDAEFSEKFVFYRGYHYYDVTTKGKFNEKDTYVYMAGKGLDLGMFFRLNEGEYYEYGETSGELPALVGGEYFKTVKPGDLISVNIKARAGFADKTVNLRITGTVDIVYYPEKIGSEAIHEMKSSGIVVCPDIYLGELMPLNDKLIVLDNNLVNIKPLEYGLMMTEYGVVSGIPNLSDNRIADGLMYIDIPIPLFIIAAFSVLVIVLSGAFFYKHIGEINIKEFLKIFSLYKGGALIALSALLLTAHLVLGDIAFQYKTNVSLYLTAFGFYVIELIIMSLLQVKKLKKKEIISGGTKYEKI